MRNMWISMSLLFSFTISFFFTLFDLVWSWSSWILSNSPSQVQLLIMGLISGDKLNKERRFPCDWQPIFSLVASVCKFNQSSNYNYSSPLNVVSFPHFLYYATSLAMWLGEIIGNGSKVIQNDSDMKVDILFNI